MLVHQDSHPRGLIYQREHGLQRIFLQPAEEGVIGGRVRLLQVRSLNRSIRARDGFTRALEYSG